MEQKQRKRLKKRSDIKSDDKVLDKPKIFNMLNSGARADDPNKGQTILMSTIGVATVLVALVGATFAYFSATIDNSSNQSISVTTATPSDLKYISSDQISLTNAKPGDSDTGSFTVSNPTGNSVTYLYTLDLIIENNTFVATTNKGQLTFKITPSTSGSNTPSLINYSDATDMTGTQAGTVNIIKDQRIDAGETHTYNTELTFVELNTSQNENQGKSFAAHIDISNIKSTT